eukprot:2867348-Pleurochrysis_carterae.AAC.1
MEFVEHMRLWGCASVLEGWHSSPCPLVAGCASACKRWCAFRPALTASIHYTRSYPCGSLTTVFSSERARA